MSNTTLTKQEGTNALMVNGHQFKTTNAAQVCRKIVAEAEKVTKSSIAIGRLLSEIKIKKLYSSEGYDKFSTFVEEVVGFKSAQYNRFMQVYNRCTNKGELPEQLKGFSDTALGLIAQKADTPEKAVEIVNTQKLTPTMSMKEIETAIKPLNTAKGKTSKTIEESKSTFDYSAALGIIKNAGKVFVNFTMAQLLELADTDLPLVKQSIKVISAFTECCSGDETAE